MILGRLIPHVDVEIPPHAAPERVDIELVNPDKRSAVLAGSFRYEPVPAPPKIAVQIYVQGLMTAMAVRTQARKVRSLAAWSL